MTTARVSQMSVEMSRQTTLKAERLEFPELPNVYPGRSGKHTKPRTRRIVRGAPIALGGALGTRHTYVEETRIGQMEFPE